MIRILIADPSPHEVSTGRKSEKFCWTDCLSLWDKEFLPSRYNKTSDIMKTALTLCLTLIAISAFAQQRTAPPPPPNAPATAAPINPAGQNPAGQPNAAAPAQPGAPIPPPGAPLPPPGAPGTSPAAAQGIPPAIGA